MLIHSIGCTTDYELFSDKRRIWKVSAIQMYFHVSRLLTPNEILAALFAAAVHDVDHPGNDIG